jgi:hypothetical protein
MLVNTFGNGKAILANIEIADPLGGGQDSHSPVLQIINGLLTEAGACPAVDLRAPDGGALPGFETRVWENGSMTLVGVWRTMEIRFYGEDGVAKSNEGVAVKATLPDNRVVYDLRNGRCLGSAREFTTAVQTGRVNFFALVPRELGAPQLAFATAPAPMTDAIVTVHVPGVADSETRVAAYAQVIAPDGTAPAWGARPIILDGGTGRFTFRSAANDAPGTWRVRIRELFSGRQSELTWVTP